MRKEDINIRDPFVLSENGTYYLYGTRAANFGQKVAGFDVYTTTDLVEFSEPHECFNSEANGFNREVNWAPEVHKINGSYYMFATFTQENGLRGTYILKADSPLGPFRPHSDGAVTPRDWMSLDGTFLEQNGKYYIIFCHEHVQIIDGTICYQQLSDDLTHCVGEPTTLFSATSPYYADENPTCKTFVTDGPFMYTTKDGVLLMIWSTFLKGQYAECLVRFKNGKLCTEFEHLAPLIDNDGGHGMLFRFGEKLMLTFHSPNQTGSERPFFIEVEDTGDSIKLV